MHTGKDRHFLKRRCTIYDLSNSFLHYLDNEIFLLFILKFLAASPA